MKEKLQNSIANSVTARWTVLVLVSFLMLCGYFITDIMAPIKPLLESEFGWSSNDYGIFTSAYGWFNVFLIMLIIGGIILDKMGVRFTGLMSTAIMIVGVALKYWAISTPEFATEYIALPFFGDVSKQLLFASLGFATFGVGIEIAGITVSKIVVKWFTGKELALAMGLQVGCARIGTGLAIGITPLIIRWTGEISMPILIGLLLLVIGLISFIVYTVMDNKFDAETKVASTGDDEDESFKISDIFTIASIKGFWYLAILCVLFYSAVFPFLKYATDLMINKFGVEGDLAGIIPSLLPFGTILLTPIFGTIYDRKGYGATIMVIGAVMLIVIHALFAVPFLTNWMFAVLLVILLGVAFSLVPSAMWPSVAKIIPQKKLGTAFSLIFWIQNWGLMGVPYLIGYVLDRHCQIEGGGYDYTIPMLIFTGFSVLALVFALLLKREDRIKGFGLQLPNIKK